MSAWTPNTVLACFFSTLAVAIVAVTQFADADERMAAGKIAECGTFGAAQLAHVNVVISKAEPRSHRSLHAGIDWTGFDAAARQAAGQDKAEAPILGVNVLGKKGRVEVAWAGENRGVMLVYDSEKACNAIYDVVGFQRS